MQIIWVHNGQTAAFRGCGKNFPEEPWPIAWKIFRNFAPT
jgi:hypothetical protein